MCVCFIGQLTKALAGLGTMDKDEDDVIGNCVTIKLPRKYLSLHT